MNDFPLEVIEYIAKIDYQTWLILVQTYKFLAEKSFDPNYNNDLKLKFLQKRNDYENFKIAYCLPNGDLHNYENPSIDMCGSQTWYQNGKRHRNFDLPAIIFDNGHQIWYQNGKRHRNFDLPAVIWVNGTQEWYQNGQCHREYDRPAIIYSSGRQEWYLDNKFIRAS